MKNILIAIFVSFTVFWNTNIQPWVSTQAVVVKNFFNQQVEQRKPGVIQETNKQKQDIKQELPQITQAIWEKWKELVVWWNKP